MSETNLDALLSELSPTLRDETFVFCSVPGASYGDFADCEPLGAFVENEGLTLIIERGAAVAAQLSFEGEFRLISLGVNSSLEAIGLTAAVTSMFAAHGISANVVAAFHHDHVFVPAHSADSALNILQDVQRRHSS